MENFIESTINNTTELAINNPLTSTLARLFKPKEMEDLMRLLGIFLLIALLLALPCAFLLWRSGVCNRPAHKRRQYLNNPGDLENQENCQLSRPNPNSTGGTTEAQPNNDLLQATELKQNLLQCKQT